MKKRLFIALIIIAAASAGGFWYWTTTPHYAVQQAYDALKHHDVQKFNQWVDVRNLSSSAVEDLVAEPVRGAGGLGLLERIVGLGVLSILRPTVVEAMTKQINAAVAHTPADEEAETQREAERSKTFLGEIVQLIKPPSLTETLRDLGFSKQNYRGVGNLNVRGSIATVPLRFYSPKKSKDFEVMLELHQPQPNTWRIERISNLQQLCVYLLRPNQQ